VSDAERFPPGPHGENGITALADYIHGLGMKLGIYVTPGISKQAVALDTPILGTDYSATRHPEHNYNCGGMVGIDYSKPGAQAFIDSIVDQLAAWGVDYVKLDGITDANAPDVVAWSDAIRQSGRPMQLDITEGQFSLALAGTLDEYATQWEYSPDIECYECESEPSSFPLTDYHNVKLRFAALAKWHSFSGSQFDAYTDLDSVEVGNCHDDGLSVPARQTVLSLWSLASSPLIIGTNLTDLCKTDLEMLENTAVLAVDQDGIAASPIAHSRDRQIIAKTVAPGHVVVGLFDTGEAPGAIHTTASALGLESCPSGYALRNLWSGQERTSSDGRIAAIVPAQGVALLEVVSRCAG
jgi:hypothetical protein